MSYGQYSYDRVGKLTIAEQLPGYGGVEHKRVGHNRVLWTDKDGVKHFRLIKTDIVSFDPKAATFTLDYDGFHTKTTSKAMGEALGLLLPEGYDGAVWSTGKTRKADKRHTLRLWTVKKIDGSPYKHFDKEIASTQFEESITFRLTPNGVFDVLAVDGERP